MKTVILKDVGQYAVVDNQFRKFQMTEIYWQVEAMRKGRAMEVVIYPKL